MLLLVVCIRRRYFTYLHQRVTKLPPLLLRTSLPPLLASLA